MEDKNELPEERALLCDSKWLFDLAFLVDVINYLNHPNMKPQGTNSCFLT